MSRYGTTKAKDAIIGHAAVNGWSVEDHGLNITMKKRGRPAVAVRFGKTGDIFSAAVLGDRAITGRDKLGQVIEELSR